MRYSRLRRFVGAMLLAVVAQLTIPISPAFSQFTTALCEMKCNFLFDPDELCSPGIDCGIRGRAAHQQCLKECHSVDEGGGPPVFCEGSKYGCQPRPNFRLDDFCKLDSTSSPLCNAR